MKFEELEEKAQYLQDIFAQKTFPGTNIKVNWIIPVPTNHQSRENFSRCYNSRVPFDQYFKSMNGQEAEVHIIGMDGNWYPFYEISDGFENVYNQVKNGILHSVIIKYKI